MPPSAPGANDSATIRPLSALLHRRRRPTPLRISTRPRGAEASTIWSTVYANRCHQQIRIIRTMPLAARSAKDTAYDERFVVAIDSYVSRRKQQILQTLGPVAEAIMRPTLYLPRQGQIHSRSA